LGTKSNGTGCVPDICQSVFDSISPTGIPELTRGGRRTMLFVAIKKTAEPDDDLRPHYDFDYTKMKPNRFAGEKKVYKESSVQTKASRKSRSDSKK
jgi:hypothetical protein